VAEVGRRRGGPVAAMVRGVGGEAGGVQRRREPRVTGAVLGEAVSDLDGRARRSVGRPAPAEETDAVFGLKEELAPRHPRPPQ